MVKGKLQTLLIVVILASMSYMTMGLFYTNMVTEYEGVLNFTTDDRFDETFLLMNETLQSAGGDMTATHQDYLNTTGGTQTTASDSMILKSFGVVKDFLVNSFRLITKIIPDTATKLNIPLYWVIGFMAIILIIIIITIVSGFFKITTW